MSISRIKFQRFLRTFGNVSLNTYFGISDELFDYDFQLLSCTELEMLLIVKVIRKYRVIVFVDLPTDINRLIASYITDKIEITFKMTLPIDFPFIPPVWSFVTLRQNFLLEDKNYLLEKHYDQIIKIHNKYNTSWSAAMEIDKDILVLLEEINHFKRIFHGQV